MAVTLARTRRIPTPLGTVSLHHMQPALFHGFEMLKDGAKVATPEKALFDLLYLAPARSRLFSSLPELEVPRSFRWSELRRYTTLVASASRRHLLADSMEALRKSKT